jgi:SOS-response transcriptional repressor LexA
MPVLAPITRPATAKQAAILAFCRASHAETGRLPSSRAIQAEFGHASQTAALGQLWALVRRGLLGYDGKAPGHARFKLLPNIVLVLFAALTLCSCEESSTYWHVRYEPTTPEEQKAVAEQVKAIMAGTPTTLSGDKQNWQQAIEAATKSAKESLCKPTLWESYAFGRWTGKWKHLEPTQSP